MSHPVRISDLDMDYVEQEIVTSNRSKASQVEYWMRIGRAVEQSNSFNYQNVKLALDGAKSIDDLSPEEDALFMDEFEEKLWNPSNTVQESFKSDLIDSGSCVGLDEFGNLVTIG